MTAIDVRARGHGRVPPPLRSVGRFIIRRLAAAIPLLLVMTALTFVLLALIPGNAARDIIGADGTPQEVAALEAQLHLNQPLPQQYASWLTGVLHGNLGRSVYNQQPVAQILGVRLSTSLSLILVTILVASVVGIGLGALSAFRGGWLGRAIDIIAMLGFSVPSFWFAYELVVVLALHARLLPATGYVGLTASPAQWLRSLALPVTALSAAPIAALAKQTRDSVSATLDEPYITALRGFGLPRRTILLRHISRNAAIPVVTILGLVTVALFGGSVLIEQVFALPGLGSLAVASAGMHDLPVILGVVLGFGIGTVIVNTLVDALNGWLDPRIRRGAVTR
jgi:peptide/nickel transport system permease protein